MTTVEDLAAGRVFPDVTSIRDVSLSLAIAVARHAYDKGLARTPPGRNETVEDFVSRKMYFPDYVPLFNSL